MYSPRIPDRFIPVLYHLARRRGAPMTALVAEAVAEYLHRQAPPSAPPGDEGPVATTGDSGPDGMTAAGTEGAHTEDAAPDASTEDAAGGTPEGVPGRSGRQSRPVRRRRARPLRRDSP